MSQLAALLSSPNSAMQTVTDRVSKIRDMVLPGNAFRGSDRIAYVQPDGPLQTLPFSVLTDDRLTVVKVASLVPRALRKHGTSGAQSLVVAYSNPNSQADTLMASTRSGASDLSPLPFVHLEVDALRERLNPKQTTYYLEDKATRSALINSANKRFGVVHIAAHALANPAMPGLSWIQLADGKLLSAEIEQSNLAADLVLLSACETALGQNVSREGIFGLTRSFMVAGAENVIASLWQVSDRATAALFSDFYRHYESEGISAAEALRLAQREVRGNDKWRHPYYWGGFELWHAMPVSGDLFDNKQNR
ncbi:MAG: CHAT domain-containing protein [Woeseiaceae bacterium]